MKMKTIPASSPLPSPALSKSVSMSISLWLSSLLLFLSSLPTQTIAELPSYVGPQDRFWRHHVSSQSLVLNGVDYYYTIQSCLFDDKLTTEDVEALNIIPSNRTIGTTIQEASTSRQPQHVKFAGQTIFVEVENAMTPMHAKAIQSLAECIRTYIPSLHEHRAMYKEFELDEDPGIGGNNPTHLAPLVGIFLPQVRKDMMRVLSMAHSYANWTELFEDDYKEFNPDTKSRTRIHPNPENLGFRASEHLTYTNFPKLAEHHDGGDTAYTLNYALSGPDDYDGGYLYILDKQRTQTKLKPDKYSASVFLGGLYLHGVTEIYGGHREMFSSEMWYNPDLPFGMSLWSGNTKYMESFIRKCNKLNQTVGEICNATFGEETYQEFRDEIEDGRDDYGNWIGDQGPPPGEHMHMGRKIDSGMRMRMGGGMEEVDVLKDVNEAAYLSRDIEPYFFMPKSVKDIPANNNNKKTDLDDDANNNMTAIYPVYFRTNLQQAHPEAYGIFLPDKLTAELKEMVVDSGLYHHARRLIYDVGGCDVTERDEENHLITLNDGMIWSCSTESRWRGMDMIWLNPATELSFEYYLSYLRRGNLDMILSSIGKQFQPSIQSLMMVGMEVTFLSYFDHDPEYHQIYQDLPSVAGSVYAVNIPLHIPDMGASTYIGDREFGEPISHHYNRGLIRGSDTSHGTAECDYRPSQDVRISLTIYVADLNDDNIADIVQENTALWPTEGDFDWYESQKKRMWTNAKSQGQGSKDNLRGNSRSLTNDLGRDRSYIAEDMRDDCESLLKREVGADITFCNDGRLSTMEQRLDCAKTCGVYMDEDLYAMTLEALKNKDHKALEQMHNLQRSNYEYHSSATPVLPPGHKFIYENDPELTHVPEDEDDKYVSTDVEPNFLVPKENEVEVGELFPLYYRDTRHRVKNDEAYGIALPPQLLQEFQAYVERNGMLRHARRLIYEEEPFGNNEHRLYKLDDGMTWGCMGPRWGGMDMIWIDPADEQCFESMMSVLRRGNFDIVLDAVGKKFDLDDLMVTGIGPIFLSHFKHDPQYNQIHVDLPEAKGSFYNVVVPLYIPKGGATLYVGDSDKGKALPIQMRYNVGTVLGAASPHGTGECDYRADRDVRLSVAIYLADVNKRNIEDVAGDSTSLWPTEGDLDWFWSQKGRVWRRDGSRSLKNDAGREDLQIEDERDDCESLMDLCMKDPTGVRLQCSKTCEVYLTDETYKSVLEEYKMIDAKSIQQERSEEL